MRRAANGRKAPLKLGEPRSPDDPATAHDVRHCFRFRLAKIWPAERDWTISPALTDLHQAACGARLQRHAVAPALTITKLDSMSQSRGHLPIPDIGFEQSRNIIVLSLKPRDVTAN